MAEVCPKCGLPKELCVCEEIAIEDQQIKISTARRRFGKLITIVEGFDKEIDIRELGKDLKARCACGGTYTKEGKIELQGDQKRKVQKILSEMGYSVEMSDVRS
ncbi:MAG TPA: translation initiation factor [Candidatus Methanofastidiosa archaeon]|nr:translation initiation factor [Candidatus Methanofastidiosa archaeon]